MSPLKRLRTFTLFIVIAALMAFALGSARPAQSLGPGALPNAAELYDLAQTQGTVRLIVGLNMATQPEPLLSPAGAQGQRAAIQSAQQNILTTLGNSNSTVNVLARYTAIPFMALETDAAGVLALANSPSVSSLEEDIQLERTLAESTSLIGAQSAWGLGYDGTGVTVAVIDDGVYKYHPFLNGKVVSEACYTTDCTANTGNDVALPKGTNSHGTHVAGIAAGRGSAFSGVAKGANIIAVRVFSETGGASYSDVVSGLQHVYDLRGSYIIAAINMSLGTRYNYNTSACDATNPSMTAIIQTLRAANIATVISSGNDAYRTTCTWNGYTYVCSTTYTHGISFPACISSAISVGATDKADKVASFSQTAPILTMVAPGVDINSSVPTTAYALKSGTSMAAPHVTGVLALLRQRYPAQDVTGAVNQLISTGIPTTAPIWGTVKNRINIAALFGLNNELLAAYPLPLVTKFTTQDPQAATKHPSDPQPSCILTGDFSDTVWYTYAAAESRALEVTTAGSSYDTVLVVYRGTALNNLVPLVCNDNDGASLQSRVAFTALKGYTYKFMIAKRGTADMTTPTTLKINTNKSEPRVSYFGTPALVPPYSQFVDIDGATVAVNDPDLSCTGTYSNSVWFKWVAPTTRTYRITTYGSYYPDTGSEIDTVMGVFTGTEGALTQRACDDDGGPGTSQTSQINFAATGGTTYYVLVGKFGTSAATRMANAHLTITPGADTQGVWRPSSTMFYYRNAFTGPVSFTYRYGVAGDIPLAGDWNGNGVDTVGVYRPSNNTFYLIDAYGTIPPTTSFAFGSPGDIPVVGDWDGNGRDDVGVFRPSNGTFYLRVGLSAGPATYQVKLGLSTDKPVIGDWNGDGIDTVGVWRPSSKVWYLTDTKWCMNCAAALTYTTTFGLTTDTPIAADWNADGIDTPAVFRNGIWYMKDTITGTTYTTSSFGLAGDTPLAGNWIMKAAPDEPIAPSFVPKQ